MLTWQATTLIYDPTSIATLAATLRAMAILLGEVVLPYLTGLPRDVSINSWHWAVEGDADNTSNHDSIAALTNAFWNEVIDAPGEDWDGVQLSGYLSKFVSRETDACSVKFYDAEADPKVLLNEIHFTLEQTPFAESDYPNEIAICCSLTCTPGGSVAVRRRRGRFYVGPVNVGVEGSMTIATLGYPAVASSVRGAFAQQCEAMATQTLDDFVHWAVWSTKNSAAYQVTGGFIDNEFDTQRRRQFKATSRTTWGTPFP